MEKIQIDMLKRSTSLPTQFPQTGVISELKTSIPDTENTTRLELDSTHQLPAHLIRLLEDWHKKYPNKQPPIALEGPISTEAEEEEEETYIILSRHRNRYPLLEYINIAKPLCYWVLYLHDDGGKLNGVLVRPSDRENGVCFLEKWLGGHQFQAQPVAVSLIRTLDSFEYFPEDVTWQGAPVGSLPNEMGGIEEERTSRFSVSRKRLRTESRTLKRAGGEIYPEVIGTSRRTRQRNFPVNDQRSADMLGDISCDNGSGKDRPHPVRLNIEGLSIIPRSITPNEPIRGYERTPSQIKETCSSRPSTAYSFHREAHLTSHVMFSSPSIATRNLGIDIKDTISHLHTHPIINPFTLPASITFQLRIPRMRMERHIRVEGNEQNADELLEEAVRFFRRYDRLIGTPILECVTEDEPDCRCIYNATEMRYYIEELRERQGIVKVTVTHSARSSTE